MKVNIKKLRPDAIVPTYGTSGAAAFDFYAAEDRILYDKAAVPTGLSIEVPYGHVLKVYSRSGHASKHNTRLANCVGIVDSDYRGEIMIMLRSDDPAGITFRKGERIAQGMIVPVERVEFSEVDELSSTERGAGGFGSTGR